METWESRLNQNSTNSFVAEVTVAAVLKKTLL